MIERAGAVLALAAVLGGCGRAQPPQDAPSAPGAPAASALPTDFTPAPLPPAQPASMPPARTYHHLCDGGVRVQTDFYQTDAGPGFMVLHHQGNAYGLSQAVSASGARYVGLVGLTPETGLEWWGKGAAATLSEVNRQDVDDSRVLLECRAVSVP